MRGAGGQVEYVKIMQDFDGRSKVKYVPLHDYPNTNFVKVPCQHISTEHTGIWCL